MAKRQGRSMAAPISDVDRAKRWLELVRRSGDRRSVVVYGRQSLTVSAAARRAGAGDLTARRRLAWRELVLKGRRHAEWVVSRYKAHQAELTRLRRKPSHPDCAECFLRQERSRGKREEYLVEIVALPGSVPTYAGYRDEANCGLRQQLKGLAGGRA